MERVKNEHSLRFLALRAAAVILVVVAVLLFFRQRGIIVQEQDVPVMAVESVVRDK